MDSVEKMCKLSYLLYFDATAGPGEPAGLGIRDHGHGLVAGAVYGEGQNSVEPYGLVII